jgi:hypothetical protein
MPVPATLGARATLAAASMPRRAPRGRYVQAASELFVPAQSAAHRFVPIQLIVEIWPER